MEREGNDPNCADVGPGSCDTKMDCPSQFLFVQSFESFLW